MRKDSNLPGFLFLFMFLVSLVASLTVLSVLTWAAIRLTLHFTS